MPCPEHRRLSCVTGPVAALATTDFHIRQIVAVSMGERRVHLVDPLEDRLLGTVDDPAGFFLPRERPFTVEGLQHRLALRAGRVDVLIEGEGLLNSFGAAISCVLPVDVHGSTGLVTGDTAGTIRLWDPASGEPRGEPHPVHDGPVTALCMLVDPDGWPLIVSAGGAPGSSSLTASWSLFHTVG